MSRAQSAKQHMMIMITPVVIAAVIVTFTCSPAWGQTLFEGGPFQLGVCLWGGQVYQNGDEWQCNYFEQYDPLIEQCNTCWCINGQKGGTKVNCPPVPTTPSPPVSLSPSKYLRTK